MDEQTNNTLLFNHNLQKQKIAEAQAKKLAAQMPGVVPAAQVKPPKQDATKTVKPAHSALSKRTPTAVQQPSSRTPTAVQWDQESIRPPITKLIVELKESQGWSINDLANHAGINKSSAQKLLAGTTTPALPTIINLLLAANMPLSFDSILNGTADHTAKSSK